MSGILNDYSNIIELLSIAGEIDGRKKLQKIVYILKSLGANFMEDFYFHYYGPYSDTLTVELEELKLMNIIEEKKDDGGLFPKYTYRLKIKNDVIKDNLKDYSNLINILNEQNARFLELVATIIYFKQEGYSRNEINNKVKIVKSERKYTDEEIDSAFDFLEKIRDDYGFDII
ncbi:hypothetical protein SAMN02746089_02079 [Caldanaerobius fijiensis DSM 17918]|uniref:Antitoxin SocA-like Panacea domain-containing protein n=1 Tax=Caldanaerobius fijiensis DSM 17918 TaxID=1121256 RepID=A0A1M5CBI9_9THEO|nr:hypothetical protein [Caldanaerobius fijiensis]SHF52079.1 hypothetical protein SAMN02746089_02079 [Caldanaerobius fijiensis DSM 17918]